MGTVATVARRPRSGGTSRRAARHRAASRRAWVRRAVVAGVVVVGVIAGVVALVAGGGDDASRGGGATVVDMALGDFFIDGNLTVPAGEIVFEARNVGVEPHDVGIRGDGMPNGMPKITTTLFAGQRTRMTVGELQPGRYQLFCDIGDHVARGMVATLTVTEPSPVTAAP